MQDDFQTLADSEDDGVSVHNGFPNPAIKWRGHGAKLALDFNQLLIEHPSSTFLFKVSGHNWSSEGVYDGDIAIIDRAVTSRRGDLVIAWYEDGFIVCRRRQMDSQYQLWGTVVALIHKYR